MTKKKTEETVTEFLTIRGVAKILDVSPYCISEWISRKFIPYFKLKRSVRIRKTDLDAWLEERKVNTNGG